MLQNMRRHQDPVRSPTKSNYEESSADQTTQPSFIYQQQLNIQNQPVQSRPPPSYIDSLNHQLRQPQNNLNNNAEVGRHNILTVQQGSRSQSHLPCSLNYVSKTSNNPAPALPVNSIESPNPQSILPAIDHAIESKISSIVKQQSASGKKTSLARGQNVKQSKPTGCIPRYSNQSKKEDTRNGNLSALDMRNNQSHGGYQLQAFTAQSQYNLNTCQGKSGISNNLKASWNNPNHSNQNPSCFEHKTSAAVESQMTLTNNYSSSSNNQCNSEVIYSTHLGPNEVQRAKQSNNIYPTQCSTALQKSNLLKSMLMSEDTAGFIENSSQYPASKVNNLIETSIAGGNRKDIQGINISPNEWIDDINLAARVYIAYKLLEPFADYEKKFIDAVNAKNTNSTKRLNLTQKPAKPSSIVVDLTKESEELIPIDPKPYSKALDPKFGVELIQIVNEDRHLNLQKNQVSSDNTLTLYSDKGIYNMKASVDTQEEKVSTNQSNLDSFLGINIEVIDSFSDLSPSFPNGKGSKVQTKSEARHLKYCYEKKKKKSNNKLNSKNTKLRIDKQKYNSIDLPRKKEHREKSKKNKKTVKDESQDDGKRPKTPIKMYLKKISNVEEGFKSFINKTEVHGNTSDTNKYEKSESLDKNKNLSSQGNHIVGCIIHTSSFPNLNKNEACFEVSAVGNTLTDKSSPNENTKKIHSPKIMKEIDIFKPKIKTFKRSISLNRKKFKLKPCYVKLVRLTLSDLVKNNVPKEDFLHLFPLNFDSKHSVRDKSEESCTIAMNDNMVPHRTIEHQTTSHQRSEKSDEVFRTVQNKDVECSNGTSLISKEVSDFESHQTNKTDNIESFTHSEKHPHIAKKYNYKQNFGKQLKEKALAAAKASLHSKIKDSVDSSFVNIKLSVGREQQSKENSAIISNDHSFLKVVPSTERITLPNHNVTFVNLDPLKLENDGDKSTLKRKPSNFENNQPGQVNKKACLDVFNGNLTTEEKKIYKYKIDTAPGVLHSNELNTSPNSNESYNDNCIKQVVTKLDPLIQSTKRKESLSNMIKHAQYLKSASHLNKYGSVTKSNQHSERNSKIIESRSSQSNKFKKASKYINCHLSKCSDKNKLGVNFESKINTISCVNDKMDATSTVKKQICSKLTIQENTTIDNGAKCYEKQPDDKISVSNHSETVKTNTGSPYTVASFGKQKETGTNENNRNNKAIDKNDKTLIDLMSHDLNKQNGLVQNVPPTDILPKDKILGEVKNLQKSDVQCLSSEDKSSGIGHVTCSLSLSQNTKVYYNEVNKRKRSRVEDILNVQRTGNTIQYKCDSMEENISDNVESIVKDLVYDSTKNDPRLRPPTYRGYQRSFLEETDVQKRSVLLATKIFISQDNDLKLPKFGEYFCFICKYPFTSKEDWSDHLCLSDSKS